MNGVNCIKMALETSKNMSMGLLEDMKDAPLTFPTSKGGNHPLWILGHITYAEANLTYTMMYGTENPVAEWKELFDAGTEPSSDASLYPTMDELFVKAVEIRKNTVKILDSMTDDDLDATSVGCPEDYKDFFGTHGQCLMITALHPMMHHGQVADARRTLGRKPLMA